VKPPAQHRAAYHEAGHAVASLALGLGTGRGPDGTGRENWRAIDQVATALLAEKSLDELRVAELAGLQDRDPETLGSWSSQGSQEGH
jgi:hypothetical protein